LEQIEDAADTLAPYQFDHIYSSDLYRAQETLRRVLRKSPHQVTWEYVEELRERSGGSYEGMSYTDIRKGMSPKQYKAWERDPFEAPLHGESLIDVQDRNRDWFKMILARLIKKDDILIISHPDTIRVLIAMAMGVDLTEVTSILIEPGIPYFYYGSVRTK
jgi:broad specificity phosphatase PhoE